MKKIVLTVLLFSGCMGPRAYAQVDTWEYIVIDAQRDYDTVRIAFNILRNNVVYWTDAVDIPTSFLEGKTLAQKKAFANGQIQERCLPIVKAAQETKSLESVIGTKVTINIP